MRSRLRLSSRWPPPAWPSPRPRSPRLPPGRPRSATTCRSRMPRAGHQQGLADHGLHHRPGAGGQNVDTPVEPASITKVMTSYVIAAENGRRQGQGRPTR